MTEPDDGDWRAHEWSGPAGEFHERDIFGRRSVWLCNVTSSVLVLGSSQKDTDIDPAAARRLNLDVARRRTGGGAVFLDPSDSIWIDVMIGRDDMLWTDDVSDSMIWLGQAFVDALSPWVRASVRTERFDAGADGKVVCFASSAPGEVFAHNEKLVGISQRRGRWGARYQCVIYRRWSPEKWVDAIADPEVRERILGLRVASVEASADEVAAELFSVLTSRRPLTG